MITTTTAVDTIPTVEHDEAMHLASVEYDRFLAVVDSLREADWRQPTDCTGWDVTALLGHVLGMLEMLADADERTRQVTIATEAVATKGGTVLDALTALQVREHAHLTPAALQHALHDAVPRALAARRATTAELRAVPYDPHLPGEGVWTLGYLFDIIHTRDPWIHRVDICRATGHTLVLSADHDGRIVADIVADWARRHGEPLTLVLSGAAGGRFVAGGAATDIQLDAVEFCRILSGRAVGAGLLATHVAF